MTEKYFQIDDEIFVFHPDTNELARLSSELIEPIVHPDAIRAIRLGALEITRKQAEKAIPALKSLCYQSF